MTASTNIIEIMITAMTSYLCFHAVGLIGKLIGAGSGRVYNGRCRQPPRLAQVSLVR